MGIVAMRSDDILAYMETEYWQMVLTPATQPRALNSALCCFLFTPTSHASLDWSALSLYRCPENRSRRNEVWCGATRPCLQTADVPSSRSHFCGVRRGDLTDQQWQRLQPLLPPEKPWTGRPNEDHRRMLNGILWIHRTGAPWRDLPRRYGPMGTVSSRFSRWRKAGIWQRMLSDLQTAAEQRGEINWDLHFVDATIVCAHQHAGGARRDGATPGEAAVREGLGRSQGGFSTKLHLRAEGNGRPIAVVLTGGERNEQITLEAVLGQERSAVRDAVDLVCAHAQPLGIKATAAQLPVHACVDATSAQ